MAADALAVDGCGCALGGRHRQEPVQARLPARGGCAPSPRRRAERSCQCTAMGSIEPEAALREQCRDTLGLGPLCVDKSKGSLRERGAQSNARDTRLKLGKDLRFNFLASEPKNHEGQAKGPARTRTARNALPRPGGLVSKTPVGDPFGPPDRAPYVRW